LEKSDFLQPIGSYTSMAVDDEATEDFHGLIQDLYNLGYQHSMQLDLGDRMGLEVVNYVIDALWEFDVFLAQMHMEGQDINFTSCTSGYIAARTVEGRFRELRMYGQHKQLMHDLLSQV